MNHKPTYEELLQEIDRISQENISLRKIIVEMGGVVKNATSRVGLLWKETTVNSYSKPLIHLSVEEKVALFQSIFRGRKDVFARRWYSVKTEKSGYQPVCLNEWRYGYCDKKKTKCPDCPNRQLKPLEYNDVYNHLAGKDEYGRDVIGLYPILEDNTCNFLCADFDDKTCEHGFEKDVLAYVNVAEEWNIPCYIERSRSGNGSHVWIFFEKSVLAIKARKLGNALLTEAMLRRKQMSLNSYDRLFPNQDTLADGGFGNLVALPLQGKARRNHNSVFVDKDFIEIYDQWAYLKDIHRVSALHLDRLLQQHAEKATMGEFSKSSESKPWETPTYPIVTAKDFAKTVTIVRANMLYISLNEISVLVVNHLKRIAAFKNPDFYSKRAMHLSIYNIPRIISCSDVTDKYIALPRGCEDAVTDLLDENNVDYTFEDKTNDGNKIQVKFKGELRPEQEEAVNSLVIHNNGILHATTAFGKTVTAIGLIAGRKVNTLILVHTTALLDQWKQRLQEFLEIDFKEEDEPKKRGRKKTFSPFGTLDSTGNSLHGWIDIALIQSCLEDSDAGVKPFVRGYGMVIVDECHHVPAVNFEMVLRYINSKYVYGLTATPTRKDGHQPIIYMQCGPIRYVADAQQQIASQNFTRILTPRFTTFRLLNDENSDNFNALCDKLIYDERRNDMIVTDAIAAILQGRTPIILSSRTKHVQILYELLKAKCPDITIVALVGSEKEKEKREKMELLAKHPTSSSLIIVAIDKYVGEGFDYPRLDTLLLTMPFSNKARVAQYAGRMHRYYEGKTEVRVLDYVDIHVPIADKMYRRRLKGYFAIGYNRPNEICMNDSHIQSIFSGDDFFGVYLNDIKENADKSIVIVMPKIWLSASSSILDIIAEKQAQGVDVAIFTMEKDGIGELQDKGIQVKLTPTATIPCAIIDKKLIWYGSVNLLAKVHTEEHVIRMNDVPLAEDLLGMVLSY
jgi:superfamily II DNA or RNA helicase